MLKHWFVIGKDWCHVDSTLCWIHHTTPDPPRRPCQSEEACVLWHMWSCPRTISAHAEMWAYPHGISCKCLTMDGGRHLSGHKGALLMTNAIFLIISRIRYNGFVVVNQCISRWHTDTPLISMPISFLPKDFLVWIFICLLEKTSSTKTSGSYRCRLLISSVCLFVRQKGTVNQWHKSLGVSPSMEYNWPP